MIEYFSLVFWLSMAALVIHALQQKPPMTMTPADPFDEGVQEVEREFGARFAGWRPGSGGRSAYGTIGEATVAITVDSVLNDRGSYSDELVVVLEGPRLPRGISFAMEGGGTGDVLTGDPAFDDAVEVHGEPSVVLAMMDKALREQVTAFVDNGGTLRSGRLRCHAPLEPPQVQMPALVRMTLGLADTLHAAEKGGVGPRLARHAAGDPLPEVRLLNLIQLLDKFTATREALATSRAALADTSPWVRLAAARFLRAEVDPLEALARDPRVPDQAAAEAVALLAARLAPEKAGPRLLEILDLRTGDTQRQAVEQLGRLRHGPALDPLVALMERAEPRTAAAAATALGVLGDPRAETSLLATLARGEADLRLAATRALGELGTVASVAPLLEVLESRGMDAAARHAVRSAIAAIQSRLVGAGAGQLTVAAAESESGRVSLAGPEAGALTLTDDGEPGTDR